MVGVMISVTDSTDDNNHEPEDTFDPVEPSFGVFVAH